MRSCCQCYKLDPPCPGQDLIVVVVVVVVVVVADVVVVVVAVVVVAKHDFETSLKIQHRPLSRLL